MRKQILNICRTYLCKKYINEFKNYNLQKGYCKVLRKDKKTSKYKVVHKYFTNFTINLTVSSTDEKCDLLHEQVHCFWELLTLSAKDDTTYHNDMFL